MRFLNLSLPLPAENLALDEALLELSEASGEEILRFWQSDEHFIVLGYSNKARLHADLERCADERVSVLRRVTGGGTVLQGPGCLNFALALKTGSPAHRSVTATNAYVLERHARALSRLLGKPVERRGETDLTIGGRKISGNAQRRRSHAILFHGSFLLGLDLARMERLLPLPPLRPAYRLGRPHAGFVANLGLPAAPVVQALRREWEAHRPLTVIPLERVKDLVRTKYSDPDWNLKF